MQSAKSKEDAVAIKTDYAFSFYVKVVIDQFVREINSTRFILTCEEIWALGGW